MRRYGPAVNGTFNPIWNGHGSNVPALSEKIDDGPVIVAPLKMIDGEVGHLRAV
jgi:hypothetical protein